MTPQEIEREIVQVLSRIAPEADPAAIDRERLLPEQLDLDSMDQLNFLIALGKRFAIDIPEADYPQLLSIAACRDYLFRRAGAA